MIRAKSDFAPLRRQLSRLATQVRPSQLRTAVEAGGIVIMSSAKSKAPVLDGTLRRSIHVGGTATGESGSTPDGKHQFGDIGPAGDGGLVVSVDIGTNLIYAATHEFGDSSRGIGAQPYLRPALAEAEGEALQKIREVLLRFIR